MVAAYLGYEQASRNTRELIRQQNDNVMSRPRMNWNIETLESSGSVSGGYFVAEEGQKRKRKKMKKTSKKDQIAELKETLQAVKADRDDAYDVLEVQKNLRIKYQTEVGELKHAQWVDTLPAATKPKHKHALCVSFDLWPISDFWRFNYTPYQPGYYFQLCLGPLRLDFYAD